MTVLQECVREQVKKPQGPTLIIIDPQAVNMSDSNGVATAEVFKMQAASHAIRNRCIAVPDRVKYIQPFGIRYFDKKFVPLTNEKRYIFMSKCPERLEDV